MCGIVGGFGPRCKKRDIQASLTQLSHRGKDESIFASCGSRGFWGMNRLSIQDSKTGLYPFQYKHYSLIFNGEIYNFAELTRLLDKKGIHCKTTCDAEVILPLFDLYGTEAFKKLDGMFAIAIYDQKKNCFYLARDLFGEKPLYYTQSDQSVFFASELHALPQFAHRISESAIPEFLSFGFLSKDRTFYQNVFKVMPGECVTLTDKSRVQTQFDQISFHINSSLSALSRNDQVRALDKALQKVVTKKLVGEAPIGIFLSGGLDSSLLTALVQQQNSLPAHTYSIGFSDQQHDESAAAQQVSNALGTDHAHLIFNDKDIRKSWDRITQIGDEPICDPAILPTVLLAGRAAQDVKVVLAGEGADEIFGGYDRYKKITLSQMANFPTLSNILKNYQETPWPIFKVLAGVKSSYSPVTYQLLWKSSAVNRMEYLSWLKQVWQETSESEDQLDQLLVPQNLQLHDLKHYVAEQLCMKTDKTLMMHTIESRAPYLDKTLLPFLLLAGQEISEKPFGQTSKTLLRNVAERYLPANIVKRPKHGFSVPLEHILKDILRKEVNQLHTANSLITKYADQVSISNLVHSFLNGNHKVKNDIWNLVVLNTWLSNQYFLNKNT